MYMQLILNLHMQTEHLITDPNPTDVHRNIVKQVILYIFLNFLADVTLTIYWPEIDKVLNVHFSLYDLYLFVDWNTNCIKESEQRKHESTV